MAADGLRVRRRPGAARASFEAAYARWMPRVYAFALAYTASAAEAERVTRGALTQAFRSRLFESEPAPGAALLGLLKAELARSRGDSLTESP
jgi:DNA-directed RNA polymerase specialized sigma24 family protein